MPKWLVVSIVLWALMTFPRVAAGEHKETTIAQQEVQTRLVEKLPPDAAVAKLPPC